MWVSTKISVQKYQAIFKVIRSQLLPQQSSTNSYERLECSVTKVCHRESWILTSGVTFSYVTKVAHGTKELSVGNDEVLL